MESGENITTFDDIYHAYAARVLNLAHRLTGDEETARDLTQEIFIKVYQHLDTFEHRSHVFTWLYRIAVNHITNHLKRERRRRLVILMDRPIPEILREEGTAMVVEAPSTERPVDRRLEDEERAKLVWSVVRSLPVKYRVPLVLFHYDGMSYKEISESLGLSMSAVEARIHRAKKQLIKKLEPWLDRV